MKCNRNIETAESLLLLWCHSVSSVTDHQEYVIKSRKCQHTHHVFKGFLAIEVFPNLSLKSRNSSFSTLKVVMKTLPVQIVHGHVYIWIVLQVLKYLGMCKLRLCALFILNDD